MMNDDDDSNREAGGWFMMDFSVKHSRQAKSHEKSEKKEWRKMGTLNILKNEKV